MSRAAPAPVVLMDVDGTLAKRDTFFAFIIHAVGIKIFLPKLPVIAVILLAYGVGSIKAQRAKELILTIFFKGWSKEELSGVGHSFAAHLLKSGRCRQVLLDVIKADLSDGKEVYLVSASLDCYLMPLAGSLGVKLICTCLAYDDEGRFTGCFVAPGNCNGEAKLEAVNKKIANLKERRAEVYGNSSGDFPMLSLARDLKDAHYNDFKEPSLMGLCKLCIRQLRVQQYIKNAFVFIPIFFSGSFFEPDLLFKVVMVFCSFCCVCSFIYVLNDLKDAQEDRLHPIKRFRPIAYGKMSHRLAVSMAAVLLMTGLALSTAVNHVCLIFVLSYVLLNLFYVYVGKKIALFDLFLIAIGFNLRVFAGSVPVEISISEWLILMTFLLCMFLAAGKRWDDLSKASDEHKTSLRRSLYGYNREYAQAALTFLSTVNTICYILYTMDTEVVARLGSEYVYLSSIWVIMGNLRYLQDIFVTKTGYSPTKVLIHDKGIMLCVIAWVINIFFLIYYRI